MILTAAFEMMLGAENEMCVEFGVVDFVGCRSMYGFGRGDRHFTSLVAGIGSTVPGMLFLVRLMWVRGLENSVNLFIVFVDVFTGVVMATL